MKCYGRVGLSDTDGFTVVILVLADFVHAELVHVQALCYLVSPPRVSRASRLHALHPRFSLCNLSESLLSQLRHILLYPLTYCTIRHF
jgi:hypothetical protein